MFLTAPEAESVDRRVARLEARTGVQVVTALAGKSDSYLELPWTAFALGASLAACGLVVADWWRPEWATARTALVHAVIILAVAASAALLAVFVPGFARLFLRTSRRDVEVRQYAESLFLRHEIFLAARRTGVLVFVSLFERRIVILADAGLRARVAEAAWDGVVARMAATLRRGRPADALLDGLEAIEALLVDRGFTAGEPGAKEFSNRPVEEGGT